MAVATEIISLISDKDLSKKLTKKFEKRFAREHKKSSKKGKAEIFLENFPVGKLVPIPEEEEEDIIKEEQDEEIIPNPSSSLTSVSRLQLSNTKFSLKK